MARFTKAEEKAIYMAVGYVLEQQCMDGDFSDMTDEEWAELESIQRKLLTPAKREG